VPDVVAYAVQRALETLSDGIRQEPNLRARLEKIDAELANLGALCCQDWEGGRGRRSLRRA